MSAKRQATSDLNHDNWDREDEPEKRGSFSVASEDELRNRVIKKARRKVAGNGGASETVDGGASKSVFSGFAGFGKTSTIPATNSASPFSFLSKIPVVANASSNATVSPTFSFGNTAKSPKTATQIEKLPTKAANDSTKTVASDKLKADGEKSSSYYAKLKGLNQEVSSWIKTHVDKNPLCILTPIFKDYENHLKNIDKEEDTKRASALPAKMPDDSKPSSSTTLSSFKFSSTTTTAPTSSTNTPSATPFSFGSSAAFGTSTSPSVPSAPAATNIFGGSSEAATVVSPKSNGFSFGVKTGEKPSAPTPTGFSFGTSVDDNKTTTGFSFTPGGKPFSFGNIQPPAAITPSSSAAKADDEDDEDQPPKVEFKQVVEENAVYSKKCKVFVKKDATFADRGVGTLYLKPVKDSEKTQLLVRADTNLGNILVNLILSDAVPTQRMGKNNVMMVCLPTPDVEKPTSLLLRVKTADEADELLQTLNKYKK